MEWRGSRGSGGEGCKEEGEGVSEREGVSKGKGRGGAYREGKG